MSICRSTTGKCAPRTVVALGAVALFSMGAPGADKARVQAPAAQADQATVLAKSADFNRPIRAQGPGAVDISRATIPSIVFAPAPGTPEGPGIGIVCTQAGIPANCQLPDQAGHGEAGIIGATSDAVPGFHVIEGFVNDTGGPLIITEICWWGFYLDFDLGEDCGFDVPSDDFTITYYQSDPGCPNAVPTLGQFQTFAVGNTALKGLTGNMVGGQEEYEYSATVSNFGGVNGIADGQCFWIGIQNNTPGTVGPNCVWLWSTADGNNHSYQDGAPDPINDFDLAVCINGELGDQSLCALPPDELCIDATGNCFEPNDTNGCDDACCCTLTCEALPFCCFAPWDQACADVAIDIGCTELPPLPLCQDAVNCQVYTPLNAFNSTGDPGAGADLFHAADDFTVAFDGVITSLCFHGAYLPDAVTDSFVITVYDDIDGLPGNVLATASEAGGTLTLDLREDTNTEIGAGIPVWQYSATIDLGGGAGIPVVAGTCYWLEIVNDIGEGGVTSWFWEWAEIGPTPFDPTAGPRQGNGRCLVDGVGDGVEEPDGYDFFGDTVASNDFAFCIGIELASDTCGFGDMGTDTGPHDFVLFNGADSHLGWSSGDLDAGPGVDDQRRTVQAFTLPAIVGPGLSWGIEHLLLEGFDPGNINDFINFEIFTRTSLDVAPGPADSIALFEEIEFGGGFDGDTEEFGIIIDDFFLDPGDYWLTFWASNSSGGTVVSNVAWFTGAPDGINNFCTENMPPPADGYEGCTPSDPTGDPPGSPAMLRARLYPAPGFGAYTLDPIVLDVSPANTSPGFTAADLYNAAFRLRMRSGVPPVLCPWDCQAAPDGAVGINDFLDLLAQWTQVGSACDFGDGPPGVGVEDFLSLLANWGPCP